MPTTRRDIRWRVLRFWAVSRYDGRPMAPDEIFAAYEALLSRAVAFARGMGELGPSAAESRWLTRCDLGLRLHWLDDDERSLLVPAEAFTIDAAGFSAWVLIHRIEREERREANASAFDELVRHVFGKG